MSLMIPKIVLIVAVTVGLFQFIFNFLPPARYNSVVASMQEYSLSLGARASGVGGNGLSNPL